MTSANLMPTFRKQGKALDVLVASAGLRGDLALCLDAGCRRSYDGTGGLFRDISGNGRDFTLGTSTTPGTTTPTFNGTIGAESANEYFSSDGGDGFQKATANDTFFNSLHQSGWNWSVITLEFYTPGNYGAGLVTHTGDVDNDNIGVATYQTAPTSPVSIIGNGSDAVATVGTGTPMSPNIMLLTGYGFRYNSTTSRDVATYVNGVYQLQSHTGGFTPSASAAGTQAKLGLTSNNSAFLSVGRRIYGFLMFDKQLSQAEFDALRAALQRRWPTL